MTNRRPLRLTRCAPALGRGGRRSLGYLLLSLWIFGVACSAENASVEGGEDVTVIDWVQDPGAHDGVDACAPGICDPAEAPELEGCERWAWDDARCACEVLPAIIDAACDDGDRCTVEDRCTSEGLCVGRGIDALCDDHNPCTQDSCDSALGCVFLPTILACEDGNPCTEGDTCEAGHCQPGAPSDACGACDSQADNCEESWGDGAPCNGELACVEGHCASVLGPELLCPLAASGSCAPSACDPALGACGPLALEDGVPCADGNLCTRDDSCEAGACVGVFDETLAGCLCEDSEDCLFYDDADLCNGRLSCVDGRCEVAPATVVHCDQTPATGAPGSCARMVCAPETGACVEEALADGMACEDGDPCSEGDRCLAGACESGGALDCSALDGACSAGACDAALGACVATPTKEGELCDEGDPCVLEALCVQGTCVTSVTKACDDDDPCTEDLCSPDTGLCVFTLAPIDVPELCNAIDDDCDGLTDGEDEDVAVDDPRSCEQQWGVCKDSMKPAYLCVQGGWQACSVGAYVAHTETYEAVDEASCDALDNDCDGATDELLGTFDTTCGTGACLALGTAICVNGQELKQCTPASPLSDSDESCDAVDNDCDGQTDEDYQVTTSACGQGACAAEGVRMCDMGQEVDTCAPVPPADEICDSFDNDCNGQTDEGAALCIEGMACQKGQCLPEDMVLVPAGEFFRGCNAGLDTNCLSNEKPGHLVFLEAFLVDRTEVPASRYQACVDAGSCSLPAEGAYEPATKPNHPATGVTYEQALAYCGWMDRRLPTESEWEKAARGGCELATNCAGQARLYPWGNTAPSCATAWYSACTATAATRPVGTLPDGASPYGALDMAGNAAEWVADWYMGLYEIENNSNPTGPDFGTYRSIRGGNSGGSNGSAAKMRVSWRGSDVPHMTWSGTTKGQLGFRCALSVGDL